MPAGFIGKDIGMQMILLAIEDITERRQREEELKKLSEELARSNTDLRDFAYVASHDLKKPLQSIEGFAKLLARRYKANLMPKLMSLLSISVAVLRGCRSLLKTC